MPADASIELIDFVAKALVDDPDAVSVQLSDDGRTIELETEFPGTPDDAWEVLTQADEIARWFPLEARVEPGVGGKVWLSWGPGMAGEAPIHVWEPGARFGWTENYGEDAEGRPIEVTVDFHIEGRDGTTVVRLVQAGFSDSSKPGRSSVRRVSATGARMCARIPYLTPSSAMQRVMPAMPALAAP